MAITDKAYFLSHQDHIFFTSGIIVIEDQHKHRSDGNLLSKEETFKL